MNSKEISSKDNNEVLKIFYFGSMSIGKPNGPGLNERDFIEDISIRRNVKLTAYAPFEDSLDLDNFKNVNIRKVYPYPIVREINAVLLLIYDFFFKKLRKPNIVIFRVGQLPLIQLILIKFFNIFSIPTHLKTIGVGICNLSKKKDILNKFNYLIIRNILKNTTSIDTPTNFSKNKIKNTFDIDKKKILIINNGAKIPKKIINNKKNLDEIYFGYIGRFPYIRGGKQVVESVYEAKKLGIDAYGIITGDESEIIELEALTKKLDVAGDIDFVGILPQDQMHILLNKIDIGLSIVEGIQGTAGQKLRQYLMYGCVAVHMNDEFMLSTKEDFIIEYTTSKGLVEKLITKEILKITDRNSISKWAKENVSYEHFNAKRINHFIELCTNN
tara:strand:+ start:1590 stop:2747 length:1158 start_codon:yes stop_codon:yes gene_type:complete